MSSNFVAVVSNLGFGYLSTYMLHDQLKLVKRKMITKLGLNGLFNLITWHLIYFLLISPFLGYIGHIHPVQASTINDGHSFNDVTIFPLQLSAQLTITSHLLQSNQSSDTSSEERYQESYPPSVRHIKVYYDYINKLARADIEAGYEAAKTYIRRYDQKIEYMVRLPPINDCKRSYLGEVMPFPMINDLLHVGQQAVDDIACEYYLHEDYETRIHIYMASDDGRPVKLIQEAFEESGESIPLLTYDYSEVVLGPPEASHFEIPPSFEEKDCQRYSPGFPYLHVFHYFVKF